MDVSGSPSAKQRPSRAEKNARNRLTLLHAAAEVVGEVGYQGASIARIIDKAGLSNGTFYLHFSSRQDILDRLLPFVGEELFEFLRAKVSGATTFLEVEERGLRGNYEYILAHPSYSRVLREAEVFAPEAYRVHVDNAIRHVAASLTRGLAAGEMPGFKVADVPLLARLLLAMRVQLLDQLMSSDAQSTTLVDRLVGTYVRFITEGLAAKTG